MRSELSSLREEMTALRQTVAKLESEQAIQLKRFAQIQLELDKIEKILLKAVERTR